MKKFVVGDIHGGHKALLQVLEKVNFDYEKDQLISLGDVCDGWSDVSLCFEELLKIKNLIYVIGNHDKWFLNYLENDFTFNFSCVGNSWLHHGGKATLDSYKIYPHIVRGKVPDFSHNPLIEKHKNFLTEKAKLYHLDEENRLFVHGGFDHEHPIEDQSDGMYYWDREYWEGMWRGRNWGKNFNKVFLGHTPTINFDGSRLPIKRRNTWNLDTGACFIGPLTLMNIETEEYVQSDLVMSLYPTEFGRNGMTYNSLNRKK